MIECGSRSGLGWIQHMAHNEAFARICKAISADIGKGTENMKPKKAKITRSDAFALYLRGGWHNVMPFDNSLEDTFLRRMEQLGYEVCE